jgi:hypothetical protein
MQDLGNLFTALATSAFRRKFRLGVREQGYLADKGLAIVLQHARDIIDRCLAPASLVKDGSETPFQVIRCTLPDAQRLRVAAAAWRSGTTFRGNGP